MNSTASELMAMSGPRNPYADAEYKQIDTLNIIMKDGVIYKNTTK